MNTQEVMEVTIFVKPKNELPNEIGSPISPVDYVNKYGADVNVMLNVLNKVKKAGLTVKDINYFSRSVKLQGTVENLNKFFKVNLTVDGNFKSHTEIPHLETGIESVHGLNTHPVAKPHFRVKKHFTGITYTPKTIAEAYDFPTGLDGTGAVIGIIELGGGFSDSDVTQISKDSNVDKLSVTAVLVDGGTNTTGSDADGEVDLDYQLAGIIAPKSKLQVYFAPNTNQGFLDAITKAIKDNVDVISISWGGPENSWSTTDLTQFNNAFKSAGLLGIPVCVASGDNGSDDGVGDGKQHVDFPGSSPYVLCCGGTSLTGSGEVVWNDGYGNGQGGGGVSSFFKKLSYQSQIHNNMRTCPDVAGNADQNNGYNVLINGQYQDIGGTSAVAPLYAGLLALCRQKLGKKIGFINNLIYKMSIGTFNDITVGTNGYYHANKGYDYCTGLGSPNGTQILEYLTKSTS